MASSRINAEKMENSLSIPDSGPSLYPPRERSAEIKSASSITKKRSPYYDRLQKWTQPNLETNRMSLIEIRERAVDSGLVFVRKVLSKLENVEDSSLKTMANAFKERAEALLEDLEQSPIYVGFIGGSGVGKSTLINALLGVINLLPTDSTRACTATVVLIIYNKDDDENAAYRLEALYANATEWQEELEIFFRDITAHFSHSGPTGEADYEDRKKRIEEALVTLRVIYPHLKSIEQLRNITIADLMEDREVSKLLGTIKEIKYPTKGSFVRAIRPYIASVNEKDKAYGWPLIKCVKLYSKATILRTGLVFVDLPGNMDRNTARGSIAMKYLKELKAPVIVASSGRGIDDQNAHQLLESVMKTDLQLDGTYTKGNLCFVLTQFDRAFDASEYLRHNPILMQRIRPHFDEYIAILRTHKQREQELRVLRKRKRCIADEDTDNQDAPLVQPQGSGGSIDVDKKIESLKTSIRHLETSLSYAESKIIFACNDDRKTRSTAAVRADYEHNLEGMGKTAAESNLQVFCTAAPVYLAYCNAQCNTKTLGFPTKQSTEIPKLRDWLYQLTLPEREIRAKNIISNIELFIGSMKPWIYDRTGDRKMTLLQRREGELIFKDRLEHFHTKMSTVEADTKAAMAQLVRSEIYSRLPEVERNAVPLSANWALRWGELAWNTHKAINVRRGDWNDVKNRTDHKWNRRLASDYKDQVLFKRVWNETFNERFPGIMQSWDAKIRNLIAEFASTSTDIEILSQFDLPLELVKEQFLKASDLLSLQTHAIMREIENKAKDAHRLAEPIIKKHLKPMYDICGAESGTGLYERNRERHREVIERRGFEMHHKITIAIKGAINKLLEDIPAMLSKKSSAVIVKQLGRDMASFFEHNSTHGTRTGPRKLASPSKVKLQDELDVLIADLMGAWKKDIKIQSEVDEDEGEGEGEGEGEDEDEDDDDIAFEVSNRFGLATADDENDGEYVD